MAERKSPTASATKFDVGTIKVGNDGNKWIVQDNTLGVKRWKRYREKIESKNSHKSNNSNKSNKSHKIYFCEPYSIDDIKKSKSIIGFSFTVTDTFYKKLCRKPESYSVRNLGRNAYRFGPAFSFNDYKLLGYHANDGGQTGLIDIEMFDKEIAKNITDIVLDIYSIPKKRKMLSWDNRTALKQLRKKVPYIIFLGDTIAGDVGAELYAHYDKNHNIDSLIIDAGYFNDPNKTE
jgi:hypothetical protein